MNFFNKNHIFLNTLSFVIFSVICQIKVFQDYCMIHPASLFQWNFICSWCPST